MKWINAEQQVTVTIYDEEHEEHLVKTMTVEEMLDTYANEGCPTIYSNPQPKTGKWIYDGDCYICNKCKSAFNWWADSQTSNYCPNCGAKMKEGEEHD